MRLADERPMHPGRAWPATNQRATKTNAAERCVAVDEAGASAGASPLNAVLGRHTMRQRRTEFALLALLAATACDTFYRIDAEVTDCATGLPIADVRATVRVEHAVGDPSPRVVDLVSTSDGRIRT